MNHKWCTDWSAIHYGGFHTWGVPLFMDTLICFVQKHVCPTYLIYIYVCVKIVCFRICFLFDKHI